MQERFRPWLTRSEAMPKDSQWSGEIFGINRTKGYTLHDRTPLRSCIRMGPARFMAPHHEARLASPS